jgi:hypothetical protein
MNSKTYEIAGFRLTIADSPWVDAVAQLSGFVPFLCTDTSEEEPTCTVHDGTSLPCPEWTQQLYLFDYEGTTSIFGTTSTGYRLDLQSATDEPLHTWTIGTTGETYLQGNAQLSLVRFALWTALGIALARHQVVAIHSSCLVYEGKAVLCLGESGTGKSTHTRLWRTHIPGTTLLNDDSPQLRVMPDGTVRVFGCPWSGKTPCYKAESYPLAACIRLSQAPSNQIRRLPVLQAYGSLHPSAPPAFAYDEPLYDAVSQVLSRVVEQVPVFHLACLPDEEAAQLACRTVFPK